MPDNNIPRYFQLFNEIGIVEQLARAMFEARLPEGMLVTHFSVLNHLVRVGDGRTPLALARAFQTPKTSMTHTLAGLERHGLVDIRPNPKDKRSKCVFITDAGRRFREDAIAALAPDLAEIAEAFPVGEIEPVLEKLTALRVWMDARRDRE
jgi:DNA-binding MarR family transcriptional regulator